MLQVLHEAKQKLMRLDILLQWSHKAKAAVQCKRVLDSCQQDGDAMVATADQLAYLHSELLHTRAPIFEVPLSFRILRDGDVQLLPSRIWKEVGLERYALFSRNKGDRVGREDCRKKASLQRMMFLLRSKVMEDIQGHEEYLELEFNDDEATVLLRSKQLLFEIVLCLAPAPSSEVTVRKWCCDDAKIEQRQDAKPTGCWRWRALSVRVLPLLYNTNIVSPGTLDLIRQSVEDRMWVASDLQVLQNLGLQEQSRMSFISNAEEKESDIPDWMESPVKAANSIMARISSHILIGVVLSDSARALESGSWKGLIKVGKPLSGNGIRIELWCNLPTISVDMHAMSKSDAPLDEQWSGEDRMGAELEVKLNSSEVIASVFPTGTNACDVSIAELCGLGGNGSVDLNRVLLRIAKDLSARVLECIACVLRRLVDSNKTIGNYFVVSFVNGEGIEPPRLDLMSYNEAIMSLSIHLKSGYPVVLPGFSILEDGPVTDHAQRLINIANGQLKRNMEGFNDLSKATGQPMALYYCSLVAKKTLHLWSELVSFISLRHILYRNPLCGLAECSKVPGVLVEPDHYTFCYKIVSPVNMLQPESQSMIRKAFLTGYFVLYSSLGSIRFESSKLCIYEMDSMNSSITRERIVYENVPHWDEIVSEDVVEEDVAGKKRSREDAIVTLPKIRRQLSSKSNVYFQEINRWVHNKFMREFMLFQFENLKLQHASTESDLVFNISLPHPLLQAMRKLDSDSNPAEPRLAASQDFSFSITLSNSPLTSWPKKIFDCEQQSSVEFLPRLSHSNATCSICDTSFEIQYSKNDKMPGVWNGVLDIYHILECQVFAKRLMAVNLTNSGAISLSIERVNLDHIEMKLFGKGWRDSSPKFECCARISWSANATITKDWPHGAASLVCNSLIHYSKGLPSKVSGYLDDMLQNLMKSSDVTMLTRFIQCFAQYSYLGHFLEDCLGTQRTRSVAKVDQDNLQFSDGIECSILCSFTFHEVNRLKCSFRIHVAGFTDFACSSIDGRTQWLNELWNMWSMETGWKIERRDGHVCAPNGDLESLSHILSELLFAAAGQR